MHWVCIIENQWVLEICHTWHIILHAQCEAHINTMNSYATGISEIIPFGGFTDRGSLEVKVTDLIYYQQGTVTNYELFLWKLGNNLFYRSCKKVFVKSISQKICILKNVTATKILLTEQNSAGYTGKKFLLEHTYIFHHYHITHQCPMCSFRSTTCCKVLRDTPFISFNFKRPWNVHNSKKNPKKPRKSTREETVQGEKIGSLKAKANYLSRQVSFLLRIIWFVLLIILPIFWDVSTQQDSSWCHWKPKA